MSEFDRKKALAEEIAGLSQIIKVCNAQQQRAEEKVSQAEHERDAALMLLGFAKDELTRRRALLDALRKEEEKNG